VFAIENARISRSGALFLRLNPQETGEMIDHIELQTRLVAHSARFYTDVLKPLGYEQKLDGPLQGFGANGSMDLFIAEGEPSANVHFAFSASTRAAVNQSWAAAMEGGYTLDREPALMPHIHPDYYAGFVRDPDGRLVEIVCQTAE
jgi:catechol 2,3-dioxygenase-like lactoylglutathione lyase family enzyme